MKNLMIDIMIDSTRCLVLRADGSYMETILTYIDDIRKVVHDNADKIKEVIAKKNFYSIADYFAYLLHENDIELLPLIIPLCKMEEDFESDREEFIAKNKFDLISYGCPKMARMLQPGTVWLGQELYTAYGESILWCDSHRSECVVAAVWISSKCKMDFELADAFNPVDYSTACTCEFDDVATIKRYSRLMNEDEYEEFRHMFNRLHGKAKHGSLSIKSDTEGYAVWCN